MPRRKNQRGETAAVQSRVCGGIAGLILRVNLSGSRGAARTASGPRRLSGELSRTPGNSLSSRTPPAVNRRRSKVSGPTFGNSIGTRRNVGAVFDQDLDCSRMGLSGRPHQRGGAT